MKLKATFAKRRDGSYGCVTDMTSAPLMRDRIGYRIDSNGMTDVPDEFAARLIGTGNFIHVEQQATQELKITNGNMTVDLVELDKSELLAIANEIGLEVDKRSNAQNLRIAIYAHTKTE
jgi:hypothetical protein